MVLWLSCEGGSTISSSPLQDDLAVIIFTCSVHEILIFFQWV